MSRQTNREAQEARRLTRAQRRRERRRQAKQATAGTTFPGWIRWLILGVAAAIVIGVGAFFAVRAFTGSTAAGQFYSSLGNKHLKPGEPYSQYNSSPPTSGPHDPGWQNQWGVYDTPQRPELMVHAMEHGGVIIWHNCQKGDADCDAMTAKLKTIVQGYLNNGKNIVVTPYSGMDEMLAVTSWSRLDKWNPSDKKFGPDDERRVRDFIERNERRYNPEGF